MRLRLLFIAFLAGVLFKCAKERDTRDYVQPNIIRKDVLQGEWYMARTIIDLDYEGSTWEFIGDMSYQTELGTIERIKWVIDKDYLYAFRSYELTEGANPEAESSAYKGGPVAVFKIISHLDLQQAYNPRTGEKINVIEENTKDRPWFERRYMRVDWSQNLITSYYWTLGDIYEIYDYIKREPAPFFIQEGSDFPEELKPRFDFSSSESSDRWSEDYPPGTLYHMSFVTQEIWSPNIFLCLRYPQVACSSNMITVRNSFLRVPEERDYEPLNMVDTVWDRFGIISMEQSTYQRGGRRDPIQGLSPEYGETDFMNFWGARFNIWKRHFKRNERGEILKTDDGQPIPLPFSERKIRRIPYILTPNFPPHLIRTSFEVVARWNEQLMKIVRILRGEKLPEEEYNPFLPPRSLGKTTDRAKYYDCWVMDISYNPPRSVSDPNIRVSASDPSSPKVPDDFKGARNLGFVGDECILTLSVNSCDRDPNLPCEQLGDLRYLFFVYMDMPGIPFCGVSLPLMDPLSGELISSNLQVSGECLERVTTRVLEQIDLINGVETEETIFTGENVRRYFESLGYVHNPFLPLQPGMFSQRNRSASFEFFPSEGLLERLGEITEKLRGAEGRAMLFDRASSLVGKKEEYDLIDKFEIKEVLGLSFTDEEILDEISPFRKGFGEFLRDRMKVYERMAERFMSPYEWVDHSVEGVAKRFRERDLTRSELTFEVARYFFYKVMLHEMGHSLGLEHNFAASADFENYDDRYYEIANQNPWPKEEDFNLNDIEEVIRWKQEIKEIKKKRQLQGIDHYSASSIMDYHPDWYIMDDLGRFDVAALSFSYGGLVEAYVGDPRKEEEGVKIDIVEPHTKPRVWWKYYLGGEPCRIDHPEKENRNERGYHHWDCPYARWDECPKGEFCSKDGTTCWNIEGGEKKIVRSCLKDRRVCYDGEGRICAFYGERSHELLPGQFITQRCELNPRTKGKTGVCNSFDQDFQTWFEKGDDKGTPEDERDLDGDGEIDFYPVRYKWCTNNRVRDISWCNMFDKGASFKEIVENFGELYDRRYIWWNFRRNRAYWRGRVPWFIFSTMGKIYQHLLFRFIYEPRFLATTGPFGFLDQLHSSVDILNYFASLLAQPDVGSYMLKEDGMYWQFDSSPGKENSDLDIELGEGKYMWSQYQKGYFGIYRLERLGFHLTKLYALLALSTRDWGLGYRLDERFLISFYDLFPAEVSMMFGGIILDDPRWYGARVRERNGGHELLYMDIWRNYGQRGDPLIRYQDYRVIAGGSSSIIRNFATLLSLAFFPVYFNTTFEQQLYLYVAGSGDEIKIPEELVEGTDYIKYESENLKKTFVAIELSEEIGIPGLRSISVEMLRRANDLKVRLKNAEEELETRLIEGPKDSIDSIQQEVDRLKRELLELEGFMIQLVEYQRLFGIYY